MNTCAARSCCCSIDPGGLTLDTGGGAGQGAGMSLVQLLRRETTADHEAVDARYGGFRLNDRGDYARFLLAHARALPAVEAALANDPVLPAWRERTTLLAADLAALDATMPACLPFAADDAGRWGALYVIEGSRLGGALLARSVPAGWPARYLGAKHLSGEWRGLLAALDEQGQGATEAWRSAVVDGARRTFALYGAATA